MYHAFCPATEGRLVDCMVHRKKDVGCTMFLGKPEAVSAGSRGGKQQKHGTAEEKVSEYHALLFVSDAWLANCMVWELKVVSCTMLLVKSGLQRRGAGNRGGGPMPLR